jgi:D-arabinose 1-dehydrogenase-like Zn-dependent alcohol dehydrogenase
LAGGFDVIIDSALGDEFAKVIDLCNSGARMVFFGSTAGNLPSLDARKIFWKQLQIIGTTMGTAEDFNNMLAFLNEKQIVPVVDEIFPMADAEKAFQKMKDSSHVGKIVLQA